jgi:hypothetical protein
MILDKLSESNQFSSVYNILENVSIRRLISLTIVANFVSITVINISTQ